MEFRCPLFNCPEEFEDMEEAVKHWKEEHPETYKSTDEDISSDEDGGDDGDGGDGNGSESNVGKDAGNKDNDDGNKAS